MKTKESNKTLGHPIKPGTRKTNPETERKVDKALEYLEELGKIEIDENTDINSDKTVRIIRIIIRHLNILGAKEEAEILETELSRKLEEIRNKIEEIEKDKISPAQRKNANEAIRNLLDEFPGKSIIQILPILVKREDWIAVQVAIERIERSQSKKLSIEDIIYLNEVKSQLSQTEEKTSQ